ncbi:MAG: hypothetical protein ACLPKB_07420 [Xanthobacteraceae bacterium]
MSARINAGWPIVVIALGAGASLAWTGFLIWETADTIAGVIG